MTSQPKSTTTTTSTTGAKGTTTATTTGTTTQTKSTNPLDYSKFDKLDFSSDEDDCHPNIEIGTWRRLKERMRKEKGIVKREPQLQDKWNTTSVNRKAKIIVPDTDSKKTTTESEDINTEQKSTNDTEPTSAHDSTTTATTTTTTTPTTSNNNNTATMKEKSEEKDHDNTSATTTTSAQNTTSDNKSSTSQSNKKSKEKNNEEENGVVFEARSDPSKFLNENMKRLKTFAKLDTMEKADKFIKQRPYLVHEASEGYLITYAVDRAVEGADTREIERIAERCLQIHNLVQSCQTGNVKPEIGVEIFYKKLTVPNLMGEYRKELAKQQMELVQRIEARRIERIREMEDEMEAERAPLGPGGLDPTEVLNSLPKVMQEAFMSQDVESLRKVIEQMDPNEAAYHMKRCVDAGLWVENAGDEEMNDRGHDQDQDQDHDDHDDHDKEIQEID